MLANPLFLFALNGQYFIPQEQLLSFYLGLDDHSLTSPPRNFTVAGFTNYSSGVPI